MLHDLTDITISGKTAAAGSAATAVTFGPIGQVLGSYAELILG